MIYDENLRLSGRETRRIGGDKHVGSRQTIIPFGQGTLGAKVGLKTVNMDEERLKHKEKLFLVKSNQCSAKSTGSQSVHTFLCKCSFFSASFIFNTVFSNRDETHRPWCGEY